MYALFAVECVLTDVGFARWEEVNSTAFYDRVHSLPMISLTLM